jgi:cytochrome b
VGGRGFFLPEQGISRRRVERVVWDLPTRIFHWPLRRRSLVEWLTQDDARYLDFHVFAGI